MESSGRLGGLEGGGDVTGAAARSAGDGATCTSQTEVDPVLGTEQGRLRCMVTKGCLL